MPLSDTSLQIAQKIHYNQMTPLSGETWVNINNVQRLIEQVDTIVCGYNRTQINAALEEIFVGENKENGWSKEEPVDSHRVDFYNYKDRIAVEVQFGEDSLIDIAKLQKLYHENKIDSAILVLAMPTFANEIGAETDIAEHSYEVELTGGIDLSLSGEPEIPHSLKVPIFVFGIDTLELRKKVLEEFIKDLQDNRPYTPSPALQTMSLRIPGMLSTVSFPKVTSTSLQIVWRYHFNKETSVPEDTLGEVDGVQRLIEQVDAKACGYKREEINVALKKIFEKDRWGSEGYADRHFVDYYGYRIAVEVQFGRNPIGDIAKMQRLFNSGQIDCAVLVLAMPTFGRKIKTGTNLRSLLYVLPEFIGRINPSTDGGSNIPRIFTLPLFVFGIGIQEMKEFPVPLPSFLAQPSRNIMPLPRHTAQETLAQIIQAVLDAGAKATQEAQNTLAYVPLVEQEVREALDMQSPQAMQEKATRIKSMVQEAQNHAARSKDHMKSAQNYAKKVEDVIQSIGDIDSTDRDSPGSTK